MEGQVSLSIVLGTVRVYINSSFFGYFDGHNDPLFTVVVHACYRAYSVAIFLNIWRQILFPGNLHDDAS